MSRIDLFKQHLREKRAVKVIAGFDNFDAEKVRKKRRCICSTSWSDAQLIFAQVKKF